jgi:hypothetical protein
MLRTPFMQLMEICDIWGFHASMMMMILDFWHHVVLVKHTVSIFSPDDGDSMFLHNVPIDLRNYSTPKPKTSSIFFTNKLKKV